MHLVFGHFIFSDIDTVDYFYLFLFLFFCDKDQKETKANLRISPYIYYSVSVSEQSGNWSFLAFIGKFT